MNPQTIKIFLGLFLISLPAFGQEIDFNIHSTSLSEYLEKEKEAGSEPFQNGTRHLSFSGEGQPLSFRRKEEVIPDLIVSYKFKKKDSALTEILYEWDVRNFEKKKVNKKSRDFQKALAKKYHSLENRITRQYGQASKLEGDLSDLARAEDEGLQKRTIWNLNDSTEIDLYTVISNQYEKQGAITRSPTHRIRLIIRNTRKDDTDKPKLSKARIDSLDMISRDFLDALRKREDRRVRSYLSEMIVDQVTDRHLDLLVKHTDFTVNWELFYSGVQLRIDGSKLAILQYKNPVDESTPPKEMLKVLFNEENEIIGFQPLKRLKKTQAE